MQAITAEETEAALKPMMSHEVTGSSDVAMDLWNSQCWRSDWLASFSDQIAAEASAPEVAAKHHNSDMEARN
ncbi:hypothetical protein Y032_0017g3204 [Ancylostoma ceylanicum]|uniref:Uncharacterized protein n=1 Tax=Ancylostoma ceylanicum TaxID=53326 RepID=A0A016V4K9_9BILA|nr:hypothetical protein Y032_0017g3204 [Ancylostoma ceylanicum]